MKRGPIDELNTRQSLAFELLHKDCESTLAKRVAHALIDTIDDLDEAMQQMDKVAMLLKSALEQL